ncbi:unnamed protein product [Leptosia nina]|uniref:Uncharacterized protein n=1 Tax=Leptosia nina TaxID=320188 RepID=A0AAV1JE98_9NEOP
MAKNIIFSSCSTSKPITRKGDDKKKKNVRDIIKIIKETDPDVQPMFVARDLSRLPPVTLDNVDVSRLLKDLSILRTELLETKKASEPPNLCAEFKSIKDELEAFRKECLTKADLSKIFKKIE